MTTEREEKAGKRRGPIPVTIFDQSYSLRSDEKPSYVASLAEYVDQNMRDVADRTHTADTLKIAILATLNITDELFQLRRSSDAPKDLKTRAARIESMLDDALQVRP